MYIMYMRYIPRTINIISEAVWNDWNADKRAGRGRDSIQQPQHRLMEMASTIPSVS